MSLPVDGPAGDAFVWTDELPDRDLVHASASTTNSRNQSIARLLESFGQMHRVPGRR